MGSVIELHPLCTLFPRLSGAEFEALRNDIKENGLRQPIVLHGGMILDGGNRYRACLDAGVEPAFTQFNGGNLVSFVLSANLHRRHMSPGQQAAIVASAQDWAKAQTVGKPKLDNVDQLATVGQRAAQSGASRSTQKMADKVAKADPELAKQVAHGKISLPKAMKQVAPSGAPAFTEPERDGPDDAELAADEAAAKADQEIMAKLLDSDDALATAHAEITRLNAVVAGLQQRVNGLLNEKAEAIKLAKKEANKAARLQKELDRVAA